MNELQRNPIVLSGLAIAIIAFGAVGCGDLNIIEPEDNQPTDVIGVMESLRPELDELSTTYPELSEARDIKVISASDGSSHTTAYRKNCTFHGKRGYEDIGANACAVALRVVTSERFQKEVREVAMPAPGHTWPNLKLVGWTTVHVGKQPTPGFQREVQELINEHVEMLNALDAQKAQK